MTIWWISLMACGISLFPLYHLLFGLPRWGLAIIAVMSFSMAIIYTEFNLNGLAIMWLLTGCGWSLLSQVSQFHGLIQFRRSKIANRIP